METLAVEVKVQDSNGMVEVVCNGKAIPNLTKFHAEFDKATGQFRFAAERYVLDKAGQYVISADGQQVTEPIDLLSYLNTNWRIRERVKQTMMEIEFALKNIHDTSFYNTNKMFEMYGV